MSNTSSHPSPHDSNHPTQNNELMSFMDRNAVSEGEDYEANMVAENSDSSYEWVYYDV